jgi:anti-sigma B factor antagonist
MSLSIASRERENVRILDLDGRLTVGPEASQLRDSIQACAEAGELNVVLNLADVSFIDSTGLGALVICYTTLRKAGGQLKLVNLNRRNIELLVLTKLTAVFEIFSDEQDAVNSFFPGREVKKFDILNFVRRIKETEAKEDGEA